MANLTPDEVNAFLSQPRIAHLVTLRPSGTPHVAPVWFLWDGRRAMVMAGQGAVKMRNIRRNPAVALSIATTERPLSYVIVEGKASITETGLEDMVHRICVLYDGPERGPEFARELLEDARLGLIEITVDRIMSWKDNG